MRSIDLFVNFQIVDANRNVLWRDPSRVGADQAARMTAFWGDESWQDAAYKREPGLFGEERVKRPNEQIAEAFRTRLQKVAHFAQVPPPLPMRNSAGAIVYYLYFASQKAVAEHIVGEIFDTYRARRS